MFWFSGLLKKDIFPVQHGGVGLEQQRHHQQSGYQPLDVQIPRQQRSTNVRRSHPYRSGGACYVKQAHQTLSLAVFILAWGPMLALQVLPDEWKTRLGQALKVFMAPGADLTQAIFIIAAVLVVVNAAILIAAMVRFQRTRLILD